MDIIAKKYKKETGFDALKMYQIKEIGFSTNYVEWIEKQLTLTDVSQRSELLGCQHLKIRIDDKEEGTCVQCEMKLYKTWQPYSV